MNGAIAPMGISSWDIVIAIAAWIGIFTAVLAAFLAAALILDLGVRRDWWRWR